MAKTSVIARQTKREKLVATYAAKTKSFEGSWGLRCAG